MAPRQQTPRVRVDQVVAGHFRETAGYFAYRTHGTDDWLLVLTRSGRGRFGFAGGEITTLPGEIVLVRPGTLHDYGVETEMQRWEFLWAHFHPRADWIELLDWPEEAPGLMRLRIDDTGARRHLEELADTVYRLTLSPHRRRLALAMNALEALLLWCDTRNPRSQSSPIDGRIRAAMDHICRCFADPLSLEQIAAVCGLSVSRMSHLFAEQVGVTPQKFVEQQRLSRAAQLLRFTQRSIKEISRDVGYDDPFYFTQRFRRHSGKSPRAYRQAGRATSR
jgi:AraC family transcriptional regulator, arabinose operon regulatory protein